jgi:hypothetical protein
VRITVKPVGHTFEALIRDTERDLKKANRKVGKQIGQAGVKAINKGAPRMWGRILATRYEITADTTDRISVLFLPAPKNAGGWAMRESGTRPHDIYPGGGRGAKQRKGKGEALFFDGLYSAHVWHPGSSGERAWTRAGDRLEPAVTEVVEKIYAEALTGG